MRTTKLISCFLAVALSVSAMRVEDIDILHLNKRQVSSSDSTSTSGIPNRASVVAGSSMSLSVVGSSMSASATSSSSNSGSSTSSGSSSSASPTPSTSVSSGQPDAGPASGSNWASGRFELLEAGRLQMAMALLAAVAGGIFAV